MIFRRNVKLSALKEVSPWRKISMGTWRNSCEATIYSRLDIDATAMLKKIAQLKEEGNTISTTALIGKAVAYAIGYYPLINSIIRFGKIYNRKEINIFFQVTAGKKFEDVSGIVVKNCDQLSLKETCQKIRELSLLVRQQKDPDHKKRAFLSKILPGFFASFFIKLSGFFAYTLNLKTPFFHHYDYFGSAMVTSLAMFGIDNAFVPLLPFSRTAMIVAIGKIQDKPAVENAQVVVKPMIEICVSLDHRLVDAYGASKLMKAFKRYLTNPE